MAPSDLGVRAQVQRERHAGRRCASLATHCAGLGVELIFKLTATICNDEARRLTNAASLPH